MTHRKGFVCAFADRKLSKVSFFLVEKKSKRLYIPPDFLYWHPDSLLTSSLLLLFSLPRVCFFPINTYALGYSEWTSTQIVAGIFHVLQSKMFSHVLF